jgi:hypothetical protein
MNEHSYEDGVIAGRMEAMKDLLSAHGDRLDSQSLRLRALERIVWGLLGIVVFIQVLPMFKMLLG